jgi:hypothetical protein
MEEIECLFDNPLAIISGPLITVGQASLVLLTASPKRPSGDALNDGAAHG